MPMFKTLTEYIEALGGTVVTFTFDCGQQWSIKVGIARLTDAFECGDEARFEQRVRRWLDGLPWPREDDPRVREEGIYVN